MRELEVVGVRVEIPSNQPLVLLRERDGERYLPIWIGPAEASAIAIAHHGESTPRPLTHELMRMIVEELGDELLQIEIDGLDDSIFFATLEFASGRRISARPSDSIALALRAGARILAVDEVMDQAGILLATDEDDEVEKFREFLDHIEPEDFA